jgi:patatin-like phospholipase/acyl hydrolase
MQVLGHKKRVLCIDGGGIKGIFALYILAEMEFRAGVLIH